MSYPTKKLGEVCEIYQPKTISKKEMAHNGKYKVYGANGVIGTYDKYNHEESEILVTCRGATCGAINVSEPKSWINGNAMVVHPKHKEELFFRYLFYLLTGGLDLQTTISGSAQPQITRTTLSPVQIPLPPLSEQKKIVKKIEELFGKIDEAQKLRQESQADASALIPAALHQIFEKGKKEGWEEKKFGQVCTMQNGLAFKSAEYTHSGFFVMRIANVQDGYITLNSPKYIDQRRAREFKEYILNEGDILMSLTGNVGRIGILKHEHLPSLLNQRVARIVPLRGIDRKFLFWVLISKEFINKVISKGHGMAQKNVSSKDIEKISIFVPSLAEQKNIVAYLDSLSEKAKKLQELQKQTAEDLKALKQSILHKVFSGELI